MGLSSSMGVISIVISIAQFHLRFNNLWIDKMPFSLLLSTNFQ